jgi:hypothetical protein
MKKEEKLAEERQVKQEKFHKNKELTDARMKKMI